MPQKPSSAGEGDPQISFMSWAGGSFGFHRESELRPAGWGLCGAPLLALPLQDGVIGPPVVHPYVPSKGDLTGLSRRSEFILASPHPPPPARREGSSAGFKNGVKTHLFSWPGRTLTLQAWGPGRRLRCPSQEAGTHLLSDIDLAEGPAKAPWRFSCFSGILNFQWLKEKSTAGLAAGRAGAPRCACAVAAGAATAAAARAEVTTG